jgi:hypothetical protein
MWILIVTVFWYHAPSTTSVSGFETLQACETAAVIVNKKFTSEDWVQGASLSASSVCVKTK